MKKKTSVVLPIMLLIGLFLLLYPTVSNYWNNLHQSRAIAGYKETVSSIDKTQYDKLLAEAVKYNENINRLNISAITDAERREYYRLLDVMGTGIMGYIEIPNIGCTLPIYHGTSESVLQVATGHIEGSSLPVGGEGSHCIISGHRGLPSAKLFTDLDRVKEGDVFILSVLNEKLTYEVDQVTIVEPEDVSQLTFEDGKDICTLVTCTPYGVNSHRLLVRGHRVSNETVKIIRVTSDAAQIHRMWVTIAVCIPLVLIGSIVVLLRRRVLK